MDEAISAALDFPGYYGRNLDALNDCMRNMVDHQYGWTPEATGLVITFPATTGSRERIQGPRKLFWTSSRSKR